MPLDISFMPMRVLIDGHDTDYSAHTHADGARKAQSDAGNLCNFSEQACQLNIYTA
jgi:hypothetical protein